MPRNEEDAATLAAQQHIQTYGVGDPRALARAILAAVAKFKAGQ